MTEQEKKEWDLRMKQMDAQATLFWSQAQKTDLERAWYPMVMMFGAFTAGAALVGAIATIVKVFFT